MRSEERSCNTSCSPRYILARESCIALLSGLAYGLVFFMGAAEREG
jgi:hypothetical protein